MLLKKKNLFHIISFFYSFLIRGGRYFVNIEFTINDQILSRKGHKPVVKRNSNVYQAKFTFESEGWDNIHKFALFTDGWGHRETVYLGKGSSVLTCVIPSKVLQGSHFKVSVYSGELITTNSIVIYLEDSDQHRHGGCDNHRKDIFVEIFDRLDKTIDSIAFSDNCLHLFNQDVLIESVYLPYVTETSLEKLLDDYMEEYSKHITERIPPATVEHNGLMTYQDKRKLNTIEAGANHTIVDTRLNRRSSNAIANKAATRELDNKLNERDLIDRVDDLLVEMINKE